MARRLAATSRDPAEWGRATAAARATREQVARTIAVQIEELIVSGDIMGGRALLAQRVRALAEAERRGDQSVVRACVMDVAVAAGAWVARLDHRAPEDLSSGPRDNGAV